MALRKLNWLNGVVDWMGGVMGEDKARMLPRFLDEQVGGWGRPCGRCRREVGCVQIYDCVEHAVKLLLGMSC